MIISVFIHIHNGYSIYHPLVQVTLVSREGPSCCSALTQNPTAQISPGFPPRISVFPPRPRPLPSSILRSNPRAGPLFLLSPPVHHSTPPHPAQQIARLGSLHSTLLPLLTPSTFFPHSFAPPPPRRPAARSAQQGCPPPRIDLPIRARGVAAGAGGLGRGLREAGDGGGREWFRGGRSAGPVAGDGLLRREGELRSALSRLDLCSEWWVRVLINRVVCFFSRRSKGAGRWIRTSARRRPARLRPAPSATPPRPRSGAGDPAGPW